MTFRSSPILILFRRRGVVVDNAPAFRQAAKNQSEAPVRIIVSPLEPPLAGGDGCIRRQNLNFQTPEGELSHAGFARISGLVSLQNHVPTTVNFVARDEARFLRTGIAVHEGIDVPAVPGIDLLPEKIADSLLGVASICHAGRGFAGNKKSQDREGSHKPCDERGLHTPI